MSKSRTGLWANRPKVKPKPIYEDDDDWNHATFEGDEEEVIKYGSHRLSQRDLRLLLGTTLTVDEPGRSLWRANWHDRNKRHVRSYSGDPVMVGLVLDFLADATERAFDVTVDRIWLDF